MSGKIKCFLSQVQATGEDYRHYSPQSRYCINVSSISLSERPPLDCRDHQQYWIQWLRDKGISCVHLQSFVDGFQALFEYESEALLAREILVQLCSSYTDEPL